MDVNIDEKQIINIVYTNYRGETNLRKILPNKIWFGKTKWHPEEQWLLEALDIEKNENRSFSLKDIKTIFI